MIESLELSRRLEECADMLETKAREFQMSVISIKYRQWASDIRSLIMPSPVPNATITCNGCGKVYDFFWQYDEIVRPVSASCVCGTVSLYET